METRILNTNTLLTRGELRGFAERQFGGEFVKASVDVKRKVMALGGELHADGEALLLDRGSAQEDIWGINLYPDSEGKDFIEFDSMINIRPSQGNRTRGIEDPVVRRQIEAVVALLIRE